jgi:zinc finger HIT domain-containing protein 1
MKRRESLATTSRTSARIASIEDSRGIDDIVKKRRIQSQIDALEKDNHQDDPHAGVTWSKAIPKFSDEMVYEHGPNKTTKKKPTQDMSKLADVASKKGRKLRAELTKTRMRKNFSQLIDEGEAKALKEDTNAVTYRQCTAPPSRYPAVKFCGVCGLFSKYTCTKCGAFFCSIPCRNTHVETRCKKWVS